MVIGLINIALIYIYTPESTLENLETGATWRFGSRKYDTTDITRNKHYSKIDKEVREEYIL